MKTRIFAIALALSLAACLTACGQPSSASQPDASGSSQSSPEVTETFYGRVSEVAGNELTLDLANLPGTDDAASAPADEDGEMPAMVMTPATEAGLHRREPGFHHPRRAEDHRGRRLRKAADRREKGQRADHFHQRQRPGDRRGAV